MLLFLNFVSNLNQIKDRMKKTIILIAASAMLFSVSCKKKGCMDEVAINYSAEAEKDDGSCEYDGNVAPSEITDDITVATTITSGTTVICGNINVTAKLTISPGATIIMCAGAALEIEDPGALYAVGTAAEPIVIKGETQTPGFWDGIAVRSNNPENKLDYVTIQDAGSYWGFEDANLFVPDNAKLAISNTTVSNSELNGMYIGSGATISLFSNNTFSNNVTGLTISPENVKELDFNSDYLTGNNNAYVHVLSGDVTADVTWSKLSAPLLLHGLTVSGGLTLSAGIDIMNESTQGIEIETTGYLNAVGTSSENITIRGRYNTVAYWSGIQFNSNNPNNELQYVNVSDGGSYWGFNYSNLQVNSGSLIIDNCTVSNANSWGLYVGSSSTITSGGSAQTDPAMVEANNTFTNNGTGPDASCTSGCGVYIE